MSFFINVLHVALASTFAFTGPEPVEPTEPDVTDFELAADPDDEETARERGWKYACSASGTFGRQKAVVWEAERPAGRCLRRKLGGRSNAPDCWTVARDNGLYCEEIIDVN